MALLRKIEPAAFVLLILDTDNMRVASVGVYSEEHITLNGHHRALVVLRGYAGAAVRGYEGGLNHLAQQLRTDPSHRWIWNALPDATRADMRRRHP